MNISFPSPYRLDHNFLLNSGFDHFQRQDPTVSVSLADGAYGSDRNYVLTSAANVGCKQISGPTNSRNALRLTANSASTRMGSAQIVEAGSTFALREKPVIYQGRCRVSASTIVRHALLAFTGTANAPARDVVNNWGSSTFTAGNFFAGSDLTVIDIASVTPTPGSSDWTNYDISGIVPANATNLCVFSWTDSALSSSSTFDVAQTGLYLGKRRRIWVPRENEKELCMPYCQVMLGPSSFNALRSLTLNILAWPTFPVSFRKNPTFSHNITGYSPGFAPAATEFSSYNLTKAANTTLSGTFTLTADSWTEHRMRLVCTAGTSFSGDQGDSVSCTLGSGVRLVFDSEI